MPPLAQTTRRTTVSKPTKTSTVSKASISSKTSTSKSKSTMTSPDELADQLASNLTISNKTRKPRAFPVEETRLAKMRLINSTSQSLSNTIKSGWKASKDDVGNKSSTSSGVSMSATTAKKALQELRTICPGDVDVERAASSIVGKLIALEMVRRMMVGVNSANMAVVRCSALITCGYARTSV